LPIVFGDGGEGVDYGYEEVIGSHAGEAVAGNRWISGGFARVDGAPEVNGGHQRNEAEAGAEEEINSVHQSVLDADIDDVRVFLHSRG
jgi:hypothetical protein